MPGVPKRLHSLLKNTKFGKNNLQQQVENRQLEPNLENSILATKSLKMSFSANCEAAIITKLRQYD
jgi:hypothetical protein